MKTVENTKKEVIFKKTGQKTAKSYVYPAKNKRKKGMIFMGEHIYKEESQKNTKKRMIFLKKGISTKKEVIF